MKKKSIIIADTNIRLLTDLKNLFTAENNYSVDATTTNGRELLKFIKDLKPDILLLDLLLTELDGLSILKDINTLLPEYSPIIIITSNLYDDKLIQLVSTYNITYYIIKPFALSNVVSLVNDFSSSINSCINNISLNNDTSVIQIYNSSSPESMVTTLLTQLNFPLHLNGYEFLKMGILIAVENPIALQTITKSIYPVVAERCGTLESRVERSLRTLIEVTWKKIDAHILYTLFGTRLSSTNKPTATQLIAVISNKIRQDININCDIS